MFIVYEGLSGGAAAHASRTVAPDPGINHLKCKHDKDEFMKAIMNNSQHARTGLEL